MVNVPVHWWWSWSMATDLGMSAPAPSTFLSSKTLSYESNQPYKKTRMVTPEAVTTLLTLLCSGFV